MGFLPRISMQVYEISSGVRSPACLLCFTNQRKINSSCSSICSNNKLTDKYGLTTEFIIALTAAVDHQNCLCCQPAVDRHVVILRQSQRPTSVVSFHSVLDVSIYSHVGLLINGLASLAKATKGSLMASYRACNCYVYCIYTAMKHGYSGAYYFSYS